MQCPKISSRDREEKLRAAAAFTIVALVTLAAVACSSGDAERAAGEDQGAVVLDSDATVTQTTSDQTPSPFGERFDSPLNGLSIGYPPSWMTRAATEPWGHGAVAFGAPDVDVIFHPKLKDDLYFAVVSEPLGGTSGQDWVGAGDLPSVGICKGPGGFGGGSGTLDGGYAWFQDCDEPDGALGHVVIVGTATRGYIIYLHVADERRLQATYDGDWFEAALETVELRPEAIDASNTSESP